MGDRLVTIDVGRKVGGCCAPFHGGAGSPSNTVWPGPRPASIPSGILINLTVWPQYTNVTDRTDRQRSDSIGRTVLQTVAQKSPINRHLGNIAQLCRAISSQLRHVSTIEKKLIKQPCLAHMSPQYGELRPTSG